MAKDINGTSSYSNGAYQVPQDDDSGSTVFTILEEFMTRIATHDHNGVDSKKIQANFAKINVIITPVWGTTNEPAGSLAAESDIGSKICTVQVSTTAEIQSNKLDNTATLEREATDSDADSKTVYTYAPVFSFYYLEQVSGTTNYYWQPFHPDWIWTGDQEIKVYSNVEHSKLRIVQY